MNDSIARITLDVQDSTSPTLVRAKQGDTGRTVVVSLSDGGFPYHIRHDCTVVFYAVKPDNTRIFNSCSVENNRVIYNMTAQTTSAAGKVLCEMRVYGPDDKLLTSARFYILVDKALRDDIPVSEDEVDALTHLISSAGEATLNANNAATYAGNIARQLAEDADSGRFDGADGNDYNHSEEFQRLSVEMAAYQQQVAADRASIHADTEAAEREAEKAETAAGNAERSANAAQDATAMAMQSEKDSGAAATSAGNFAENAEQSAQQAGKAADKAEEMLGKVNEAGAAQIKAIEDKVAEVLKSIPEDYTELEKDVNQVKAELIDTDERLSESISAIENTILDKSEIISDYSEITSTESNKGRINVGQTAAGYENGKITAVGVDSTYTYRKYDADGVTSIKISYSTCQNKVANYAFYGSDDSLISIFPTGAAGGESTVSNKEADVPQGTVYFAVCTRTTQMEKLHVYARKKTETKAFSTSLLQGTFDAVTDAESYNIENVHTVDSDGTKNVLGVVNRTKYPRDIVFGGEYLEHWYEKIYDGTQNVVIDIEGDSISQGYTGQNVFLGMRDHAIKRIMKNGGYDLSKVSIYNNAIGGCSTNDWVGRTEYFKDSFKTEEYYSKYANGMLAYGMEHNPDLMIVGFGMNDAEISTSSLSLKERLDLYESNFREALDRIRGTQSVNGRPAYGKTVNDLSIIITTVTNTTADEYRYYRNWQMYVRDILAKLAREYRCAYADFTQLTYGYTDGTYSEWRQINTTGARVGLHPNKYQTAYWMSALADLIYPVCMHNVSID